MKPKEIFWLMSVSQEFDNNLFKTLSNPLKSSLWFTIDAILRTEIKHRIDYSFADISRDGVRIDLTKDDK